MEFLTAPIGGTPAVVETEDNFAKSISEISSGHGPIAIDAERASGFRYSNRAYLIQIFRKNGGLHLIDPVNLRDSKSINTLNQLLESEECVIHAASQDLPCLREFGILPKKLFDTELGARIAGCERVGLGPLCENLLEISLAKEHSAVDWSTRPLKAEWLDYAALDVAVLIDLRDKVEELLIKSNKLDWARAEFDSVLNTPPAKPRQDPWRRTSGMHQIRSRAQLAIVRDLWNRRDQIAAEIDLAPGRLLSDSVITALAKSNLETEKEFWNLPEVKTKLRTELQKSYAEIWLSIYLASKSLPESDLPPLRGKSDSLPPVKIWREKYPLAYARLTHARHNLSELANSLNVPLENLLMPELVRRICFDSGKEIAFENSQTLVSNIEHQLRTLGARNWQIAKTSLTIAEALCQREPLVVPEGADISAGETPKE